MLPADLRRLARLRVAVVLWASFLGATCSLFSTLILPVELYQYESPLRDLTLLFFVGWLVALVPAAVVMILAPAAQDGENP